MLSIIALYLGIGILAGILAGLLGIGGGLVIVPILSFTFKEQGFVPEVVHQLALGTSMGTIIFTALSSIRAHSRRGAVLWDVVKYITPGIVIGVLCGGQLMSHMSTRGLKIFFICFLLYAATQMLLNFAPKASRQLPKTAGMLGMGGVIGVISTLVGIGGGVEIAVGRGA